MNKRMKNTVSAFIAVVFLLSMMACNPFGSSKSGGDNSSTSNTEKSDAKNTGKSDSKSENTTKKGLAQEIVGTWEVNDEGTRISLTFTPDGQITFDNGKGSTQNKYKVLDEETILIESPDGKLQKMKVKISGDTIITEENGKAMTFKRAS